RRRATPSSTARRGSATRSIPPRPGTPCRRRRRSTRGAGRRATAAAGTGTSTSARTAARARGSTRRPPGAGPGSCDGGAGRQARRRVVWSRPHVPDHAAVEETEAGGSGLIEAAIALLFRACRLLVAVPVVVLALSSMIAFGYSCYLLVSLTMGVVSDP